MAEPWIDEIVQAGEAVVTMWGDAWPLPPAGARRLDPRRDRQCVRDLTNLNVRVQSQRWVLTFESA
jgi:hypothetical protein